MAQQQALLHIFFSLWTVFTEHITSIKYGMGISSLCTSSNSTCFFLNNEEQAAQQSIELLEILTGPQVVNKFPAFREF